MQCSVKNRKSSHVETFFVYELYKNIELRRSEGKQLREFERDRFLARINWRGHGRKCDKRFNETYEIDWRAISARVHQIVYQINAIDNNIGDRKLHLKTWPVLHASCVSTFISFPYNFLWLDDNVFFHFHGMSCWKMRSHHWQSRVLVAYERSPRLCDRRSRSFEDRVIDSERRIEGKKEKPDRLEVL